MNAENLFPNADKCPPFPYENHQVSRDTSSELFNNCGHSSVFTQNVSTEFVSISYKRSILTNKWNNIISEPRRKNSHFVFSPDNRPASRNNVGLESNLGFVRCKVVNQAAFDLANCADQISGLVSRVLQSKGDSRDFSLKERELRERIDTLETLICEKDKKLESLQQARFPLIDEISQADFDSNLLIELDESRRMVKLQVEESRLAEESFLRELGHLRQLCEARISNLVHDHEINLLRVSQRRDECLQDSFGVIRIELDELKESMQSMEDDWRGEIELRKKLEQELAGIRDTHKSEISERDSEIIALRVARIQHGEEMNNKEAINQDLSCLVQTLRIRNDCLNRENSKLVVLNEFWKKKSCPI